MKKINFIVILLTFIVSIVTFFYIDVLAELIGKPVSYGDLAVVTMIDILGITFIIIVLAIFPSLVLAYAYIKIQASGWWVILIAITYTVVWLGLSVALFGAYISYFRDTWSWRSSEIAFTIQQDYLLLAYFLSLIPMIFLGIFNRREQNGAY